jgi:YesN/AraC family two-component response regulator
MIQKEDRQVPQPPQSVVLIVDNNDDTRFFLRQMFCDQYQIIEAGTGREGLRKVNEISPDLIISNVIMPEMDGYRFCEQIKTNKLTSHIPVILLTVRDDHESRLTGLETGADGYLAKPFDTSELKLIVRNQIEQRRRVQERFSYKDQVTELKLLSNASFDEKFLNRVLAIIDSRMGDEHFSIDELSRQAGYSNMHFYRKIKALSGKTPSQFLRTIRLNRAAELLRIKSDNVTQIAFTVGFKDLSYFNKCFKEQFGITPGKFADQNINFHNSRKLVNEFLNRI